MAKSKNGTNPFLDDDDEQFSFGNRHRHQPNEWETSHNSAGTQEDQIRQIMAQAEASENRSLESTQRCLRSIQESEDIGVETAKELIHQGEQLENVEKKLHDINNMTKTSQKHINSIRSVFGGIKSWFSKEKPQEAAPPSRESASDRAARLQVTMSKSEAMSSNMPHPALQVRDRDAREDEMYSQAASQGLSSRQAYKGVSAARTAEIDDNLGMMSDGLSRLKGLAMGLQTEIEAQNEDIERITEITGRTDATVSNQNAQMRKILNK